MEGVEGLQIKDNGRGVSPRRIEQATVESGSVKVFLGNPAQQVGPSHPVTKRGVGCAGKGDKIQGFERSKAPWASFLLVLFCQLFASAKKWNQGANPELRRKR